MRPVALLLAGGLTAGALPAAAPPEELPENLRAVGFAQQLGAQLPLDAVFVDETGASRRLGELFAGRPVLLAPVYYDCPMLCNLVLEGLARSLRGVPMTPGEEFDVVVFSFDPRETPQQALEEKELTLARYDRKATGRGWTFLTGEPGAVERLTEAIGFQASYQDDREEFAHAAGVVVATPGGTVSRTFYGIDYAPRDLRLGLVEAGQGRLGSVVDEVLLFCFHYDPLTGRYSFAAMSGVRIAGVLTVLFLAAFVVRSLRRERGQAKPVEASAR